MQQIKHRRITKDRTAVDATSNNAAKFQQNDSH